MQLVIFLNYKTLRQISCVFKTRLKTGNDVSGQEVPLSDWSVSELRSEDWLQRHNQKKKNNQKSQSSVLLSEQLSLLFSFSPAESSTSSHLMSTCCSHKLFISVCDK